MATVAAVRMAPQMNHGRATGHTRVKRARASGLNGWNSIVIEGPASYRSAACGQPLPFLNVHGAARFAERAACVRVLHRSQLQEEVVQGLGKRWMREHRVLEQPLPGADCGVVPE